MDEKEVIEKRIKENLELGNSPESIKKHLIKIYNKEFVDDIIKKYNKKERFKKFLNNAGKTENVRRFFLIIMSISLTLIVLESSLRIGGVLISSEQNALNKITEFSTLEPSEITNKVIILALGESTTAMSGNGSWPKQLEFILNNKSESTEFKVINKGAGGTTTTFILSRLEENLNKYNPNVVITMMGINDEKLGGGIRYEPSLRTRSNLFLRDFRIYKLSKWLEETYKNRINKNKGTRSSNFYIVDKFDGKMKEGLTLHEEGKIKQARKIFEEIIKDDPNNAAAHNELGWTYYDRRDLKTALEFFKKAIRLYPNGGSGPYFGLAFVYIKEKKLDEASKTLEDSFDVPIENYDQYTYDALNQYVKLGPDYYNENKLKEIISKLREKTENSDIPEPFIELGNIYLLMKNPKEAEEMFKRAEEIKPSRYSYLGLGKSYLLRNYSSEELVKLSEQGYYLNKTKKSVFEIKKYHYRLLYETLNKRGIKLVVMQYPTLDVDELKDMFDGNEDIIFIENKENFEMVLANGSYEDYFIDRFGVTFGHATFQGNRLIAENIANALEEYGYFK